MTQPKMDPEGRAILRELADAAAEHRRAVDALEKTRRRRDSLIAKARCAGLSLRRVARAAGVHYTRVRQITTAVPPGARVKKNAGHVEGLHTAA